MNKKVNIERKLIPRHSGSEWREHNLHVTEGTGGDGPQNVEVPPGPVRSGYVLENISASHY